MEAVDPTIGPSGYLRTGHLRPGHLCRLLRRVVGDPGPAHAAYGRDQRHFQRDNRRRPDRRRSCRAEGTGFNAWVSKGAGGIASALGGPSSIFGGFMVTQRMLAMYKKKEPALSPASKLRLKGRKIMDIANISAFAPT